MAVQLDVGHAVVLAPGEGEAVFDQTERTIRILVDRDELTVSWFRYEPGEEGPEPHVHRRHTDAFYVLEGELELGLGPEVQPLRGTPGTFVAAPPNVVHTFRNSSEATAVFLNIHAPGMGFGDMLRARRDGRDEDAERFDQFAPPADGGRPLDDAIVARPGGGERFDRGNREIVVLGAFEHLSVFDSRYDADWEGVDPHTHDDHVDSFFVLEGEVEFTVGEAARIAEPGSFVAAPPGVRHGFRTGGNRIRVLNLHAPDAGFAARIRGA